MQGITDDNKLRVLLVDDDPGVMQLLLAALESDDRLWLDHAITGEQALAKIRDWQPHLVMLDVMLPGRAGYAVCRLVKHDPTLADIRIVLMTALAHHQSMETWRKVGTDDFITKPFRVAGLLAKIEKLLPRWAQAA